MNESFKNDPLQALRSVKFICYINIKDTRDEELKEACNDLNVEEQSFSAEYRKRLIENSFDIMNGTTIHVTSNPDLIPKSFLPINNLEEMKQAVTQDMEGNNLNLLLNQTAKRKERDEISNIIDQFEEDNLSSHIA